MVKKSLLLIPATIAGVGIGSAAYAAGSTPASEKTSAAKQDSLLDEKILRGTKKTAHHKPLIIQQKPYFDPKEITRVNGIFANDGVNGADVYHKRDFGAGKVIITPTVGFEYLGQGRGSSKYNLDLASRIKFPRTGVSLTPVTCWGKEEGTRRTTIGGLDEREDFRDSESRPAFGFEYRGPQNLTFTLQGSTGAYKTENAIDQTTREHQVLQDSTVERQGNYLIRTYTWQDVNSTINALVNAQTRDRRNAWMFEINRRINGTKPLDFRSGFWGNRRTLETRVGTDVEGSVDIDGLTRVIISGGNRGPDTTDLYFTDHQDIKNSAYDLYHDRQNENLLGFGMSYNKGGKVNFDGQFQWALNSNKLDIDGLTNFQFGKQKDWMGWLLLGGGYGKAKTGIGIFNSGSNEFSNDAMNNYSETFYRTLPKQVILNERQKEQERRNAMLKLANNLGTNEKGGFGAYVNAIYGKGYRPAIGIGIVSGGIVGCSAEVLAENGNLGFMINAGYDRFGGCLETNNSERICGRKIQTTRFGVSYAF